ncbi:retrovirus-related pol polyprotein from transposon TNT 1-94 [Tanacetum coccineum]
MRVKMLRIYGNESKGMFGSDVTSHVRYSRLMDEFDKFAVKEGEYLESGSHANSSYSSQPYYVIHPSSVADYEDEYQGELQGDSQEDKLTTAMMLLARAITRKISTPTNNPLCTSSNTRNQAVIRDGRVDIQTKNAGYGGSGNRNAGRQNRNQAFNVGTGNDESNQIVQLLHRVPQTESTLGKANVQCYNCNEKGHYAHDCQKPRVRDAKYFREQMLLGMKDEAVSNLKDKEKDFMLDNSYGDNTLEELTVAAVSEVNASNKVHEQMNHVKRKTIIHTSDDDQIDSNIIFDDPYVEAENKKRLNNELKKQKELLQKELEMFKDRFKTFESKKIQCSKYKETCEELEREIRADKDTIERILKEKDKIESDFFKIQNEKIIIQHETQLAKKAFKERENRYLEDISQPKMYHAEMLHSSSLKIDSLDFEETLEDAKESRLKMRNKMVQLNYGKLNALYETFVPQQEHSAEQTYFSIPSNSNICSETKEVTSDLPRTLLYVTPLPKNIAVKAKKVSNTKVNADRSKPVTSHSIPKNKQSKKQSANIIARGMYSDVSSCRCSFVALEKGGYAVLNAVNTAYKEIPWSKDQVHH